MTLSWPGRFLNMRMTSKGNSDRLGPSCRPSARRRNRPFVERAKTDGAPRPGYRGSPSRSAQLDLTFPRHLRQRARTAPRPVDGRTRVGFSDRAWPFSSAQCLGPADCRVVLHFVEGAGYQFDGRDRGGPPMRHEDRPGTGVKKALASAGQGAPYPIPSGRD